MNCLQKNFIAFVIAAFTCAAIAPISRCTAQSTRDSAGFRIIENSAPLSNGARAPQLSKAPLIELDPIISAEYKFGGIAGVLRVTEGRILVGAITEPQFRLFDAKGKLLHATNERGIGDKVRNDRHTLAKLRGDTIAVVHQRDVMLFVIEHDSLRQISPSSEVPRSPLRELRVNVLSNGGSAYMHFPAPAKKAAGTQWADSSNLLLRDRSGLLVRELGSMPYVTLEMSQTDFNSVWLSATAVSCAGAGQFYYGFGNAYVLRKYSEQGELQSIIRRAWTPTPVTDADWEHWVVDWSKLWVKEHGADSLKAVQRVREEPWALQLPAFADCRVASDGNLWVREAHLDDAIAAGSLADDPVVPSKWSVFNSAGAWVGDITLPAGFQPTDIGADYVAGRFRKGPGRTAAVVFRIAAERG